MEASYFFLLKRSARYITISLSLRAGTLQTWGGLRWPPFFLLSLSSFKEWISQASKARVMLRIASPIRKTAAIKDASGKNLAITEPTPRNTDEIRMAARSVPMSGAVGIGMMIKLLVVAEWECSQMPSHNVDLLYFSQQWYSTRSREIHPWNSPASLAHCWCHCKQETARGIPRSNNNSL